MDKLIICRNAATRCASRCTTLFALWLGVSICQAAEVITILQNGSLTGWENKEFKGQTQYQTVSRDGASYVHANSEHAASGMFKKVTVDLNKTPFLNWRWRIDHVFANNDERSKGGDDYPARIYVVVSGGLFFWKTEAVNYVWSRNQAPGTNWPNAYTSNAQMIAVRSGGKDVGQWITEKRDVRADFKLVFGSEVAQIDAIAIMTDTDNTGQSVSADYGDIYFSAD